MTRRGRIDTPEIAGESRLGKFGQRAGQLDPGRPAADDHERQQPAPLGLIVTVLGAFEGHEDAAPHRRRVLDRLEAGGHRRPFIMSKIVFARPGGDDQQVVRDAAIADQHTATRRVDAGNRPEDHMGIRLRCENAADRRGDVGGRQGRSRHLVQKRLEQMVVAPVDHGHIGGDLAEPLRRGQAAKAGSDDDDARPRNASRGALALGYVGPPDNAIHGTVAAIKLALIYGMRMILSIVTSFEMLLTQQRAEPPNSAANPLLTVFLTPKIPLPAGPTNRTQLIDIIYVLVEERAFSDAQMRVFPAARGNADAGRRHCAVDPPSITSPAPVIKPESSEARKTMPLAMSSGTPSRPIGCRDMAC